MFNTTAPAELLNLFYGQMLACNDDVESMDNKEHAIDHALICFLINIGIKTD